MPGSRWSLGRGYLSGLLKPDNSCPHNWEPESGTQSSTVYFCTLCRGYKEETYDPIPTRPSPFKKRTRDNSKRPVPRPAHPSGDRRRGSYS